MTAVKNIFRYLHHTPSLGLWYPENSGFFIQAYSDADLGGCNLDRKRALLSDELGVVVSAVKASFMCDVV